MSTLKKRNGIWQYRHNEYRISLKTRDYEVAKALQKEYDIRRLTGKLDIKRTPVIKLVEMYLEYVRSDISMADATQTKVSHQISMFLEFLRTKNNSITNDTISTQLFRAYADWRGIMSIKNDMMTLNKMFSWLESRGHTDHVHVPVDEYSIKKSHKHRPISHDEFKLLYGSEHSELYEWLYYTGLRPSDVIRIHSSMINGKYGRVLTITPQKTSHSSGKQVTIILHKSLAPPSGFLFPEYLANQSKLDAARRDIKRILGKGATLYSLRYSFNARLKELGASLEIRKDAMGHTSIRTTEGYSMVDMSQMQRYIDMLE